MKPGSLRGMSSGFLQEYSYRGHCPRAFEIVVDKSDLRGARVRGRGRMGGATATNGSIRPDRRRRAAAVDEAPEGEPLLSFADPDVGVAVGRPLSLGDERCHCAHAVAGKHVPR